MGLSHGLHRLKAQKLISLGNDLGISYLMDYAPCKGKTTI